MAHLHMSHEMVLSVIGLAAYSALKGLKTNMLQGMSLEVGALGEPGPADVTPVGAVGAHGVLLEGVEGRKFLATLVAGETPRDVRPTSH